MRRVAATVSIKLPPKEILDRVEMWVVMAALENFSANEVYKWKLPQWEDFYRRIGKGLKRGRKAK